MSLNTESLGICLGASTIGLVRLRKTADGVESLWSRAESHEGNPRARLREGNCVRS